MLRNPICFRSSWPRLWKTPKILDSEWNNVHPWPIPIPTRLPKTMLPWIAIQPIRQDYSDTRDRRVPTLLGAPLWMVMSFSYRSHRTYSIGWQCLEYERKHIVHPKSRILLSVDVASAWVLHGLVLMVISHLRTCVDNPCDSCHTFRCYTSPKSDEAI